MSARSVSKGQRVVVVLVSTESVVDIRTGHICSTRNTSHGVGDEIDNIEKTVVWGDRRFNELADSADDAHEKTFEVKDPHLLSIDEAENLRIIPNAILWFAGIYSPEISTAISKALVKTSLVKHNPCCKQDNEWEE